MSSIFNYYSYGAAVLTQAKETQKLMEALDRKKEKQNKKKQENAEVNSRRDHMFGKKSCQIR